MWLVFIFANFKQSCRKFCSSYCSKSLFIKHGMVYISKLRVGLQEILWKGTPTFELHFHSPCLVTLLEKTMNPLTVWKFVGTEISKAIFSCYLYLTQYVHLTHIFPIFILSQHFSLHGAAKPFLPDSKFRISTFKTVSVISMNNDVAHLTVIKIEAADFFQKGWAPRP